MGASFPEVYGEEGEGETPACDPSEISLQEAQTTGMEWRRAEARVAKN